MLTCALFLTIRITSGSFVVNTYVIVFDGAPGTGAPSIKPPGIGIGPIQTVMQGIKTQAVEPSVVAQFVLYSCGSPT